MKKVLDNSGVAHTWANKLQDEARNGHDNLFFNGDTIFSYGSHFPIAKHGINSNGVEFILLTNRSYSRTTQKHTTIVRQAISHLTIVSCYSPVSVDANFNHWQVKAESIAAGLQTAKKPEKYLSELGSLKAQIDHYCEFMLVQMPEKLQLVLSIGNKDQYVEFAAKKAELERVAAEKYKKEQAARHKKELAKWLKGEGNRLYTNDGFDYLRLKGDKIETSQGIDLTIPYGISVYNKLKEDQLKVGDKVLQFNVNKINGVVAIGCHTFKKSYLLKFGEKLTSLK